MNTLIIQAVEDKPITLQVQNYMSELKRRYTRLIYSLKFKFPQSKLDLILYLVLSHHCSKARHELRTLRNVKEDFILLTSNGIETYVFTHQ